MLYLYMIVSYDWYYRILCFNHVLLGKPIGSVDDDKDGVVDLF